MLGMKKFESSETAGVMDRKMISAIWIFSRADYQATQPENSTLIITVNLKVEKYRQVGNGQVELARQVGSGQAELAQCVFWEKKMFF